MGCSDPYQAYKLQRSKLIRQRVQKLKEATFDTDIAAKIGAIDRLASHVVRREHGVKELLGWIGIAGDKVPSVIESGLTPVGSTDSGYFGTGVYTAMQAEYACMYALNEFSPTCAPAARGTTATVLLCWVVVGNVYPITRGADYDVGAWHAKYFVPGTGSLGTRSGFTAHHAAVSKGLKYQVPPDPSDAEYDEVVVAEAAQVLPQYVVRFREV